MAKPIPYPPVTGWRSRITAAQIDRILARTFGRLLRRHGFVQVNRRKWVRAKKAPIREVIELRLLKGGQLSPVWGFSLDYVPQISGSQLRWHRTTRGASIDLRDDPVDYAPLEELAALQLDVFQNTKEFDRATRRAAPLVVRRALKFFSLAQTVRDLPKVFDRQSALPQERFGWDSNTQDWLAYAFTLGKLGRQREASGWLSRFTRTRMLSALLAEKLRKLLREARGGELS